MNKKIILYILGIAILIIIVSPFFLTIPFSTPLSDDFGMAGTIANMEGNTFLNAIDATNNFYITWAGGGPFIFMQIIFNPLLYFSSSSFMYGIELDIFFVIFVITFYFYEKFLLTYVFNVNSIWRIRFYFLLVLFVLLNTSVYYEIFYGFVGNSYLGEVIFCFLNQILIILYFRRQPSKNIYFVLLIITGFISCFAYQLAVISGFLYIFEYYYYCKNHSRIDKLISIIPFIFMIVSGLLSVFAPGNYSRFLSSTMNADFSMSNSSFLHSIIVAIYNATQNSFFSIISLLKQPLFVALLIITIVFGKNVCLSKKYINPFVSFICTLLTIFLICFPIAYGYSSADLSNRTIFLINFSIICTFCFTSLLIGNGLFDISFIKNKGKKIAKTIILCLCVYFITIFLYYSPSDVHYYKQLPWITTLSKINDCCYESSQTKETLKFLESTDDQNVVVNGNIYSVDEIGIHQSVIGPRTGVVRKFVLHTSKDHWVNVGVAKYYNKESVVVKFD